jgi:hypothetical protein
MPVFEFHCTLPICEEYHRRFERLLRRADDDNPKCEECLTPTQRLISNFNAPFTGTLDRFDDPSKETHNPAPGGHWAFRRNSTRNADGTPEPVRIDTVQKQREYCRAEGLIDPGDLNPSIQGNESGMVESTQGLPGSWSGNPLLNGESTRPAKEKPVFSGAW